jgi:hypothetical protein
MKDNSKMVRDMDLVHLLGAKRIVNMEEIELMALWMVKEF